MQGEPLEVTASVASGLGLKPVVGRATLVTKDPGGQIAATDLPRPGPRAFHGTVDAVQREFMYQVATDQGESPGITCACWCGRRSRGWGCICLPGVHALEAQR